MKWSVDLLVRMAAGLVLVNPHSSPSVVIRNLDIPGAAVVENRGSAVSLATTMFVEIIKERGEWGETSAKFLLRDNCEAFKLPTCQEFPPRTAMTLVPWNGLTCSGQCERNCARETYLGPGSFRFVVTTCDGRTRFVGAAFKLPANDR